jgi:DNA-binding NarL/FixJ family response regulator
MRNKRDDIVVFVASPHSITRELLIGALNRHEGFRVVDGAATTQEALDVLQSTPVNVALIGASLADGPLSGFDALRQISELYPEVKSVILFYSHERHLIVDAFRGGARGVFCLSQAAFKSLCRCVEKIHSGQIWADSSELSEVMKAFAQLAPLRLMNSAGMRLLTKREEEVVRLVAEGLQNRDIASALKLSEHTIKNYLFHIFDKLGVSSRVELVLYAVSSSSRRTAESSAKKSDQEVSAEACAFAQAFGENL